MRKAVFAVVVLGIMGWLGLDCSAQSYGIPQGSRFQPVITPGDGTRLGNEMLKGKSNKQAKQKKKTAAKPKVEMTEEQEKDEKDLQELAPQPRTWTDSTGKSKVEATFVELEEDQVTLRKENGKEVTVPLARLSKNDQQLAKTEGRVWEIIDGVGEKIAELRAKHKKLEAEKRQLDAKKNRSRADLVKRNEIVDEELSLSTKIARLKEERDQKVRKLYNEYSVATGQEPRYVDDGWGKLVSRGVLAAREARENQRVEQAKTNGTPRLAADNYIQGLLKNGTLQEATYLSEQFVTPGPQRSSTERAMGAALGAGGGGAGPLADPTKWKAVYYHVKYVSRGGFAMEKDSYVLTYRVENARVVGAGARPEDGGLWAVENFYLDGVKGD